MTAVKKLAAAPEPGPGSDEDFTFESSVGAITVPSMAMVPFGVMRKARKESGMEQTFAVIEAIASPEALELIDQLGAREIAAFNEAWAAHSGASMGESSAS
jgi:hypothetical protein